MAETKSVTAVLRARDAGFSSVFSKAQGNASKLKTSLGRIAAGIGVYKAASMAATKVTQSFGNALRRADTMQNFARNMTVMTGSTSKAKAILNELNSAAKGTAYGLDVVANATKNMTSAGSSVEKATRDTKNFMNAVSFYGDGSNETFQRVMVQIQQMTAKGKANMGDLRSAMEAGIPVTKLYAEATGQSMEDVDKRFKKGAIRAEEFMDALDKAFNEGTKSFPKITDAAKKASTTWQGTFENMKAAATRGALSIVNGMDTASKALTGSDLKTHFKGFGESVEFAMTRAGNTVIKISNAIKPYLDAVREAFSGVGGHIKNAVVAVAGALSELNGGFGSTQSITSFKSVMQSVANSISKLSFFIQNHAQEIVQLIPVVLKAAAAYKAFQLGFGLFGSVAKTATSAASGIRKFGATAITAGKDFGKFASLAGEGSKAFGKGLRDVLKGTTSAIGGVLSSAEGYFSLLGKNSAKARETVSSGFSAMAMGAKMVGGSFSAALGPVGLIVLGVAVAVAAMAAAWKSNFGNIQGVTKSAFGAIKKSISSLKPAFDAIKKALSTLMPAFKAIGAILIGGVILAIATFVDTLRLLVAVGQTVVYALSAVGNAIKGVFTGNFDAAKNDIAKIKDVWVDFAQNSAVKGVDESMKELDFSQQRASKSAEKLKVSMDNIAKSAENSASRIAATADKIGGLGSTLSEAFDLSDPSTQMAQYAAKVEEIAKSTQERILQAKEKYQADVAAAEQKSNAERQAAMQKAENDILSQTSSSLNNLLTLYQENGEMIRLGVNKNGEQLTADQIKYLEKEKNETLAILTEQQGQYMEHFQKKLKLQGSFSQQEIEQAKKFLDDKWKMEEETINRNNEEIARLKEEAAVAQDGLEKTRMEEEIASREAHNAQLLAQRSAFGEQWLAIQEASGITEIEALAAQMANTETVTNEHLARILGAYQLQHGNIDNTLMLMAQAMGQRGVEGSQDLIEGLASGEDSLAVIAANLTQPVKDQLALLPPEMFVGGEEGRQQFIEALEAGDSTAAATHLASGVKPGLETAESDSKDEGTQTVDQYAKSIEEGKPKVEKASESLSKVAVESVKKKKKDFVEQGKDYGEEFSRDLGNQKTKSRTAGYDVGKAAVEGVAAGINENSSIATRAIATLMQKVRARAEEEAEINSPSKVFIRIAKFLPEGLAVGIRRYGPAAVNAVQKMMDDVNQASKMAMVGAGGSLTIDGRLDIGQAPFHWLEEKMDELIAAQGREIVMDSGALVGATKDRTDEALYKNYRRGERLKW